MPELWKGGSTGGGLESWDIAAGYVLEKLAVSGAAPGQRCLSTAPSASPKGHIVEQGWFNKFQNV